MQNDGTAPLQKRDRSTSWGDQNGAREVATCFCVLREGGGQPAGCGRLPRRGHGVAFVVTFLMCPNMVCGGVPRALLSSRASRARFSPTSPARRAQCVRHAACTAWTIGAARKVWGRGVRWALFVEGRGYARDTPHGVNGRVSTVEGVSHRSTGRCTRHAHHTQEGGGGLHEVARVPMDER